MGEGWGVGKLIGRNVGDLGSRMRKALLASAAGTHPSLLLIPFPIDELLSSLESYEIAFPTRVDHNGAMLAFSPAAFRRQRRGAGAAAEARLFYKVAAPSTHFLLNLTRSPRLLAGHVSVEYWTREGLAWQRAARAHCLYAGHLQGQAGSSHVAISTCGGLVS